VTTTALPAQTALREAQRRAEHLVEHGPTVRGPSVTAVLAVMSVFWTVIAAGPMLSGVWRFGPLLIAATGAVVAVRAWVLGRRRHTLQPFLMAPAERPLAVLAGQQRGAVARQVFGRSPATTDTAPVVRALLAWQRRSTRSALPSLVGFCLGMLALAWSSWLSAREWWLLVAVPLMVVLIAVMSIVEARRASRVLRSLPDAHTVAHPLPEQQQPPGENRS